MSESPGEPTPAGPTVAREARHPETGGLPGPRGHDPAAGLDRPLRVGLLASGRGSNVSAILAAVERGLPVRPVVVLSDRADAPVLDRAVAAGLPTRVVLRRDHPDRAAFDAALVAGLRAHGAEVVVLAGFMRLVGPSLLDAFPNRVLNVHPALCPAFPGLDAPAQAVAWGVRYSGCTVHFVDAGTDTGPVIAQAVVPISPDDTASSLHARIQVEEHRLLPEALAWLAAGRLRVDGRRVHVLDRADSP